MSTSCYILYSPSATRYYVGTCHDDLAWRIEKHNTHFYGGRSYSAQSTDWQLYLEIETEDYAHALRLERLIKSMKSRKYIENLKKYPDMIQKILNQTKGK